MWQTFLYANCTFIILIFPLAVSEAHQKVGGTEDPESGTSDLHLWSEDTRSQDKSESRKDIGNSCDYTENKHREVISHMQSK